MKAKYLSKQLKQFMLSSMFVLVAAIGLTVTSSFNPNHIAKLEQTQKSKVVKKLVNGKEEIKKKDSFYALN